MKEIDKQMGQQQSNPVLALTINGKEFSWPEQYISLAEIRKLGNIPKEDDVFLKIKEPWKDEPIVGEAKVNLARPEIEHFFSKEKTVSVVLIVNGREKSWTRKKIGFEEVVILAFGKYDNNPNIVYTVTYDNGPHQNPEGTMVKGETVFVRTKMVFNATATDKS